MGSSAKHLSAAVQQPIGARSQDRIIKELQQQHGFSSLQVRRLGSAEAKKQATFFYIWWENRVSTVSTLEFPHSNFAVYVLFTRSHGTGLLRVAASQVEGYPGAATSGRSSTLYHPSIKSIRAPDPTVADSPASTFCIYSSFWLFLTEKDRCQYRICVHVICFYVESFVFMKCFIWYWSSTPRKPKHLGIQHSLHWKVW